MADANMSVGTPTQISAFDPSADEDTQKQKQPTLSDSLQAGQKAIQDSASDPNPGPMAEHDSQYYLGELEKLSSDPRYQSQMPEEGRQSLKDALAQAKDLYHQQADKNDWMQVAQTLGRAVAQFGAASAGSHTGYNMAGLNMGPEIDYESRNRRALGEYEQTGREAQEQAAQDRQDALDRQKALAGEYGQKEDYLKSGLTAALRGESEQAAQDRADTAAQTAANKQQGIADYENRRMDELERHNRAMEDLRAPGTGPDPKLAETIRHNRAMEGIRAKSAGVTKPSTAADNLALRQQTLADKKQATLDKQNEQAEENRNLLQSGLVDYETSDNDKDKAKARANINKAAAKIGVNGAEAIASFHKNAQEPGMLFGSNTTSDPDKLNDAAEKTVTLLQGLKKARGGAPAVGPTPALNTSPLPAAAPPTQRAAGKILTPAVLDQYVQKYPQMSRKDAQEYLLGHGYQLGQ